MDGTYRKLNILKLHFLKGLFNSMKALGKVKYIGREMYELYELRPDEYCKYNWSRIQFLDFPGDKTVEEGDHIFSWYWIPLRIVNHV